MLTSSKLLALGLFFVFNLSVAIASSPSQPGYPSIPSPYKVLYAQKLVADAAIDFPAYYIDHTNGYRVTAPNGTEFIVDNIVQPKCAFYGSYIATDNDGFLGVSGGVQVASNVYIGEVNFANCQ